MWLFKVNSLYYTFIHIQIYCVEAKRLKLKTDFFFYCVPHKMHTCRFGIFCCSLHNERIYIRVCMSNIRCTYDDVYLQAFVLFPSALIKKGSRKLSTFQPTALPMTPIKNLHIFFLFIILRE